MGLDVSCECGRYLFRAGSYSGFGMWRSKLAECVGIDLDKMRGFGGLRGKPYGKLIWTGHEPFYELLNHSDR